MPRNPRRSRSRGEGQPFFSATGRAQTRSSSPAPGAWRSGASSSSASSREICRISRAVASATRRLPRSIVRLNIVSGSVRPNVPSLEPDGLTKPSRTGSFP